MFQACDFAIGYLEVPGTQAHLMLRVRLGRLCNGATRQWPALALLGERFAYERVEDEIRDQLDREEAEWDDMADMGLQALQLMAEIGCFSDDCGAATVLRKAAISIAKADDF